MSVVLQSFGFGFGWCLAEESEISAVLWAKMTWEGLNL